MRSSSSRPYAPEHSPTRKNKSQSQREYRSKEIDGFSELRDALLLVDPFDTPLGRDATRHQLLITAAKKLRNLANENEKLMFQLSASELYQPEEIMLSGATAHMVRTENDPATAWLPQGHDMGRLLSIAAEPVPPMGDYESTPAWSQSLHAFNGHGHQPCDTIGSPYQAPCIMGFH